MIVTFDAAAFKIRYPEFSAVSDLTLGAYFDDAGIYLNNTDGSPVEVGRREKLLWMLTAHIAVLSGALTGGVVAPVGRASQASEGSVSASMEYLPPGSQAWFVQTQYGAMFWQATVSLRGFRYAAKPTRY